MARKVSHIAHTQTDELVVLAEGEIEVKIEGKAERFQIGGMVFIPAKEIWKII